MVRQNEKDFYFFGGLPSLYFVNTFSDLEAVEKELFRPKLCGGSTYGFMSLVP